MIIQRQIYKFLLVLFFFLFTFNFLKSQIIDSSKTVIVDTNSINLLSDSLLITPSFAEDSLKINDTLSIADTIKKEPVFTSPIQFSAIDSMHIAVGNKTIILFGGGALKTEGIELQADSIGMDMEKKELKAGGFKDTLGLPVGAPKFIENQKSYDARSMRYNFTTKKGIIYDVMTQEQDGFLHGEIVKIHKNDEMHISKGKYTTCNHPNPHYYIDLSKAKLKNKDKIITGPFHFVIANVPIPVIVPFGFFPLSRKNVSGIHLPSYRDELDLGFGLVGGGYYWAINDYVDLDLTGDFYTKGSWGLHAITNLKIRYKFTASANLNYFHRQTGPKELSTSDVSNSYSVALTYQQDPKLSPTSNISANINYIYGNYRQYNTNDINDFVNTTTTSSVAYQRNFRNAPFRFSVNGNMSQNLKDSTVSISFPTVNFSMNSITPFAPKNKPAKGAWYEKINFSFTSQLANSLNTHDSVLTKHFDDALKSMKTGFKYDVPLSTSFTLFKYLNISPSFSYNARIYPYKIKKILGENLKAINDTVRGFNHVYNFSTNLSFNTKLYGTINLKIGKLKALRHVISPSLTYNYTPDFSEDKWGYYEINPEDSTKVYSFYESMIFGTAPKGEQQTIRFSIGNNFEAKLKGTDSLKTDKKIKIIDNLGFSQSYNFAADSLNLSNLVINSSLTPIKNTSVNITTSFDPYTVNYLGQKINKFEWTENKQLARLTVLDITIGSQIGSNDFLNNKKSGKNKTNDATNKELIQQNTNSFSWNASVNYSFRFSKKFNETKQEFDIVLTQTADMNLTIVPNKNWNIGIRTGYDFDKNQITSTTFNFYRDLHCWEMSLMLTPFGSMKSYLFKINIKSQMFQAIQVKRERRWQDSFY